MPNITNEEITVNKTDNIFALIDFAVQWGFSK